MKNVEIPKWLENLPLAPEFHPTDTEFADPIAYISKIENEASAFGMCKIIPPLPKPSRKYVLHNLNKSLSKCPELGSDVNLLVLPKREGAASENCDRVVNRGENRAVFTTRHQELGCEKGKRAKGAIGDMVFGAQKQVWQSGEVYTLEQFEAKSKNFAKSQLGMVRDVNPLVIESMFWKAASEKPIYVEYANDVPGSGFGEPEGLLSYFHRCRRRRRRRKRNSFDRNNLGDASSKNDHVNILDSYKANNASGAQNNPMFCTETASNNIPSGHFHQGASLFGRKESQGVGDKEGTAGWKLSNSPWNLQVIARSPGSLTRFMPDDIPGVTSPMVYIGMLFSWFAWHVEDHELHSLNFLHIGSAKTWYAVPGDYAFNFEEAIRRHAYGENADRMVGLSLLGEKTTVLSPEVIVSSGIPCCRLVQNPGEFVVTFPRAYHIGFSHGFNCGEAANFGTPKWLTIAKEAAVRRAAMNYLPMLSHQQLLYLLTMSFISRIPRSLLPGVRSSRLRDRLREERELSVKKAFIEDIIHENGLLTVLLKRNSYQAILWDVESLPSSSKESEICKDADVTTLAYADKCLTENDDIVDDLSDLSKYISAVGFDLNDDDLAYDFQIESGTLPCVACGILGFPFMAVIQPSEVASIELMLVDPYAVSVESGFCSDGNHVAERFTEAAMDKAKSHKALYNENGTSSETSQQIELPMLQYPSADHSSSLKHDASSPKHVNSKGWNVSNAFLRPRIFCLEHAIEIEKLLSSKGGANVLVICHSDFQKIKTHAAVIAEETAIPYRCTDIPLDNASLEDLNVVDIAIDRDEQVGCAEDWTSKLCINLQQCVRVKKSFPSKNVQHLLGLEALCCDAAPPVSNASSVEWQSRKVRSKRHLKHSKCKSSGNLIIKEGGRINKHLAAKKNVQIIQYSRKKFKAQASAENNFMVQDILDTNQEIPYNEDKGRSGNGTVGVEISQLECKQNELLWSMGCTENADQSHCELSAIASKTEIENEETQTTICTTVEVITNDKGSVGSCCHSQVHDAKAADASTQNTEDAYFEMVDSTSDENRMDNAVENESSSGDDKLNESSVPSKSCSRLAEKDCGLQMMSDIDDVSKEASRFDDSSNHPDDDSFPGWSKQRERASNQVALDSELSNSPNSDRKQHVPADMDNQEKVESLCTAVINESTSALTEEHFLGDVPTAMDHNDDSKSGFLPDKEVLDNSYSTIELSKSSTKSGSRRKRVVQSEDDLHFSAFVRSPCESLRSRVKENATRSVADNRRAIKEPRASKKLKKSTDHSVPCKVKKEHQKGSYECELDGCTMSFQTKAELLLHKANRCPVEGCRKKFNSHKYAIQHQRVHDDDRPLKCPWNGCSMSFKWAWARTEHLRVHTGERPYACKVEGCGLTFRFVSDFSRHRRKTGHYVSQPE